MKASRILIAVLLLLLVMPFGIINAQEAADVSGVFVQNAASGTLIPRGDAFVLTLSGVSEATPWVINTAQLNVGRTATSDLVGDWGANPDGLEGLASLRLGDTTLFLTLSEPAYDPDLAILTFTANVDDIFISGEAPKNGVEAPDSFDTATLFITVNSDFLASLQVGNQVRSEGLRAENDESNPTEGGNPLDNPGLTGPGDAGGEQATDQFPWASL